MTACRGLALIIVAGVLAVLLVVGVAFSQSANLHFRAAVVARDAEETAAVAETGIHQAIALLQYDVWGVDEQQAFACAEAGGHLHDQDGRDFEPGELLPGMDGGVAFFQLTGDGYRRIDRQVSKWRRTAVRVPVETGRDAGPTTRVVESDLAWTVNATDAYKRAGAPTDLWRLRQFGSAPSADRIAILSGAPLHDEFLPGPFDNFDLWEWRTHANRVLPPGARIEGRGRGADCRATGGAWTPSRIEGHTWAAPSLRKFEEFDYADTRVCGDGFFRVFRYDLVAGDGSGADAFLSFESGVDPQRISRKGVAEFPPESPRRYLCGADVHPASSQSPLRYTHLGRESAGGYADTRGNAWNINQVNNNAAVERFLDSSGKQYACNEAKWIYVYEPDGSQGALLRRYAITIVPESGLPNANFVGPPAKDDYASPIDDSARTWGLEWYFKAVDRGFSLRGSALDQQLLARLKGRNFPRDWARQAASRLSRHVRGSLDGEQRGTGPVNSRAELSLVLRKLAFSESEDPAVAAARDAEAEFLAGQLSVHSYENLLDLHWSADRLILDRGNTAPHRSSVFPENDPNSTASLVTRLRFASILDELTFAWGPDDAREQTATPYRLSLTADADARGQSRASKASSLAHLLSASLDSAHLGEWTSPDHPVWWQRGQRCEREDLNLQLLDRKPDHAIGINARSWQIKDRVKPADVTYQEEGGWAGAHSWSLRISEVGRVQPKKLDKLPRADDLLFGAPAVDRTLWPFDGEREYWFVELVANFSALDAPVRQRLMDDVTGGTFSTHWQLLVMNPRGSNPTQCDVLKFPSTRILAIDLAADPLNHANGGGDALSFDPRRDVTGRNRLKVFELASVRRSDNGPDGKAMLRPAVGSFNHYAWCWRSDLPHPLSLRDCEEENIRSLRQAACRESMARGHPANYLLVLFDPTLLPRNTAGQQIRLCCQRFNSRTDTILLNAVDLPENARPFEEGWEALDPRNNRDGRLSWRRARPYAPATSADASTPCLSSVPHSRLPRLQQDGAVQSVFSRFSGSPAFRFLTKGDGAYYNWCDGLNENALGHFAAGGEQNSAAPSYCRYDVEDHCGARSWPVAAATDAAGLLDNYGVSRGMMQFASDLGKVPLGWLSQAPAAREGIDLLPDPDLRTWADLQRVTPFEQAVTFGFLRGEAWGKPLAEDMYWLFPAQDGLDNDADGRVDALTPEAAFAGGPAGHYQSDRRSVGRVNLNEACSLAALWYAGLGVSENRAGSPPSQNLATVLGRKPHKGYVSWLDIATRLNLQSDSATPYNALIWPENQYADLSVDHAHAEEQYAGWSQKRMSLARTLTVSHSPVYTIYCIAQTIDRLGQLRAQVRVKATVERTPQGRVNILEYAGVPEP